MQPKLKENISVDVQEIAHFSALAERWWDETGPFKPLHDINPLRIGFIRDHAINHFGLRSNTLNQLSGLSLVDIGCGGGLISEPMARLGAQVTGVDASEKNIGVAALHAAQTGLAIDYQNRTAEALVKDGKQFDIVLALEIVEHVADVSAFTAAIAALVKPGGLLFMSTINRTAKSYLFAIIGAEYVLRWVPKGTHQWKKFIRPSELCGQLRSNGLELKEMTGMTLHPLKFEWQLTPRDLDVNYLLVAEKQP